MKILFVVNAHEYTAVHRLPLLNAARQRGWNVEAAAPRQSPAFSRLERAGFPVHGLDMSRRGVAPWHEWRALRALESLYQCLRPDLVHHATIKPVIYGTIAARRVGIGAVVNAVTGLGYVYTSTSSRARILRCLVNPLYRFALRHPNQRIIFQNSDDKEALQELGVARPSESILIPGSGVDTDYFTPLLENAGQPLVVVPSRMLWDKGIGEFIEAARALQKEGISARFALVGGLDPGNPSSISERRLMNWVNEGVVEWWGHSEDMRSVYQAANIVVLPSYREGLPKVLLEAAACARPVVTTDSPGCRDAVFHGRTGYLVPIRNSNLLAERINELLLKPALRASLGRAGRLRAEEEFSTKRVESETFAVYEELLKTTQPAIKEA